MDDPTTPAEPEPDRVLADMARTMEVRRINLTISAKRTIKVDDEFRSFESTESITLEHPAGLVPVAVARTAALLYTPMLVRKVFTDLVVGGVVTTLDAKDLIARAEGAYARLIEGRKKE